MRQSICSLLFTLFISLSVSIYGQENFSDSLAIKLNEPSVNNDEKIEILLNMYSRADQKDLTLKKEYLDNALQHVNNNTEDTILCKLYLQLANYYHLHSSMDSALIYLRRSNAIAREKCFGKIELDTYLLTGEIYTRTGKNDSSYLYFNKGLDIAMNSNDSVYISRFYNKISILKTNEGKLSEAIQCIEKSKMHTDTDDHFHMGRLNNRLGTIYFELKEYDESFRFYKKVLHSASIINDQGLIGAAYNNIARTYEYQQKLDSALIFLHKALEIYNESANNYSIPATYINIGNVYYKKKDYKSAKQYYHTAKDHPFTYNMLNIQAALSINLGMIETELKNYKQAEHLLLEGLNKATEAKIATFRFNAYSALSKLDSLRGNYLKAIEYRDSAMLIEIHSFDEELKNQLAELKIKHAIEKRDLENEVLKKKEQTGRKIIFYQNLLLILLFIFVIATAWFYQRLRKRSKAQKKLNHLLVLKNKQIEQNNTELEALNETKDKFFSVISHDLKGPIGTLIALLQELDEDFESFDEQERQDVIHNLFKSGENTYNLLINLLDWSLSQQNRIEPNPEEVEIAEIINEVIELLEPRADRKSITLSVSADEIQTVFIDRKMISAVIINLVNNAIKFSGKGKTIHIKIAQNHEDLQISIEDHGIGIPPEIQEKLFTLNNDIQRKGTDKEAGTGLGLVLTQEFVKLMNGKITVKSEVNMGTTFTVNIPM